MKSYFRNYGRASARRDDGQGSIIYQLPLPDHSSRLLLPLRSGVLELMIQEISTIAPLRVTSTPPLTQYLERSPMRCRHGKEAFAALVHHHDDYWPKRCHCAFQLSGKDAVPTGCGESVQVRAPLDCQATSYQEIGNPTSTQLQTVTSSWPRPNRNHEHIRFPPESDSDYSVAPDCQWVRSEAACGLRLAGNDIIVFRWPPFSSNTLLGHHHTLTPTLRRRSKYYFTPDNETAW